MKLPKNVKIANHIFKITEWHSGEANASNKFGQCDCNELTIKISTDHADSHTKETLLHETLHGIFWSYGLRDGDNQERIVTTLAAGLMQVFQDNKEVYKFLNGEQK